jgi:hypothetical protein
MQENEGKPRGSGCPPSLRAELAAAVRWVNARRAELPAAIRGEVAVSIEAVAAEVESADAAGDRPRGLEAIEAWRREQAARIEAVGERARC